MPDIEKDFSDFLESDEYDRIAEETLYSIIRAAYKAGWTAANNQADTDKPVQ